MTIPRKCYIVDIDGTLADLTHRRHHLEKKPKDWKAFFASVEHDQPIKHMRSLIYGMALTNYIIFMTGRHEALRGVTEQWLRKHGFKYDLSPLVMYMRPDGDFRDDAIIKLKLLQKARADGWEPVMAFDDRDRVVKMWRDNGIPCAQVAPGDF